MKVAHLEDPIENERTLPAVGERVRVKGREGMFLVVRIDKKAGKAHLVGCAPGLHAVERDVPLSLLQRGYDYLPDLFKWYVEAGAGK